MNGRYILFLSLGVERTYLAKDVPNASDGRVNTLSESSGAGICRRNILALACIIVFAGFAGVNPQNFNLFGVHLSGEWGNYVLGAAIVLSHLYWYVMRWYHLTDGGRVPGSGYDVLMPVGSSIAPSSKHRLDRKDVDLWANRVAAIMTFISWSFLVFWICCPEA